MCSLPGEGDVFTLALVKNEKKRGFRAGIKIKVVG